MQVLFLALGASRKRAVIDESAELAASGAQVLVAVDKKKSWSTTEFAPGIEVVSLSELEARHLPRRIERAVLYQVPRVTARAVGRGSLRVGTKRALKAYEQRVAGRVHRRLFMPLHRRLWPKAPARMLHAPFASRGGLDLLVVSDALSVPHAVRLLEVWAADRSPLPRVCYGTDYDAPAKTSAVR